MGLQERFLEWKKAVLPGASDTVKELIAGGEEWEDAKRTAGDSFRVRTSEFYAFIHRGDLKAYLGAVETVRRLRTLLERAGIELPPWIEPPEATCPEED